MIQKAKVIDLNENGRLAKVRVSRKTMCDGCSKSDCEGSCEIGSLFGANKTADASAENSIGAEIGDIVEVEIRDSNLLATAALVFILPVVLSIISYCIAKACCAAESTAIITTFAVFVLCFAVIILVDRFILRGRTSLQIVNILQRNSNNA